MPIYLMIGPAAYTGKNLIPIKVQEDRAIRGSSRDPRHLNWIPVDAYQVDSVSRDLLTGVACKRQVDGSSVGIFGLTKYGGGPPLAAIIDVVKESDSKVALRLKFLGVGVSNYAVSTQGVISIESFRLDFQMSSMDYKDPDYVPGPDPQGYDSGTRLGG